MAQQRRRKAINFDLDSACLREEFGGEQGRRKAYRRIQSFLAREGFEHRQWSGYVSKTPMSNADVYDIVDRLAQANLWLDRCVNRFDVTNVGNESDMLDEISLATAAATATEPIIDEGFIEG
jgi:virulence-associated protein VapD